MADDNGKDSMWSILNTLFKSFGRGGFLVLVGFGLVMLAIYKGPDFKNEAAQLNVLLAGSVAGGLAALLGLIMLWRGPAAIPEDETSGPGVYDVYIAAPMAGFGDDAAGRKAAVELVGTVAAALQRLNLKNVYTPVAARPDPIDYESSATAFDAEIKALRGAKRYVLILPAAIPAKTSVLMTTGMAIALKMPCIILAPEGLDLPYLLDGTVQSKSVQVSLHRYANADGIKQLFANDGLRLFGTESN